MKREKVGDLIQVGLRMRELRKQRALTLDVLARRSGLSKGLLSKFENFRAVPSLPVLVRLAQSLDVDASELLRGIGDKAPAPYVVIKADQRRVTERDQAVGFVYEALMTRPVGDTVFQAFVLTIRKNSRRKLVTTEGDQFLFVLEGPLELQLGNDAIPLAKGDALFFDGRLPHVPRSTGAGDAVILAIYLLRSQG